MTARRIAPRRSARTRWRIRWRTVRAAANNGGVVWRRMADDPALWCLWHRDGDEDGPLAGSAGTLPR